MGLRQTNRQAIPLSRAAMRITFAVVLIAKIAVQGADISGTRHLDVTVDGLHRSALLYVPRKIKGDRLPLVFVFHGHGGTAQNAERQFRMDELWPEAISVYPQGLPTPGALTDPDGLKTGWQHGEGAEGDRDLHFFDALLTKLKQDEPIDEKRIFCTGHSNGGGFTYLLWKTRPDVFAAFAPCSATAPYAQQLKPKPAIISGGRNDQLVKFQWQQAAMDAIRKVDGCNAEGDAWESIATWYSSKTGTPLLTFIYDGGHAMAPGESELIAKFFKQLADGEWSATTKP